MKRNMNWIPLAIVGGLLAMGVGFSVAVANAASAEAAASTQVDATKTAPEPREKTLDGAKVYAWNCGSCHSERWPKERSDSEWNVIATHMRVRANMTVAQTEAVLRYLQENN